MRAPALRFNVAVAGILGLAVGVAAEERSGIQAGAARRSPNGYRYVVTFGDALESDDEESPSGPLKLTQATQPTPATAPPPETQTPPATPAPAPAATPQTPAPAPRRTTTAQSDSLAMRQSAARTRIARTPEMFGDIIVTQPATLNGLFLDTIFNSEFGAIVAPINSNAFSQKISENNHPLPRDRVYYNFNVWDDALHFRTGTDIGLFSSSSQNLYRHSIGFEKTCFEGTASIDVRLPFFDNNSFERTVGTSQFAYNGGTLGNMLITGKVLLYEDEEFIFSTGMGVMAPTGEDTVTRVDSTLLRMENQAVYLSPFIGSLWTPDSDWFIMGFAQIQVSANGDPLIVREGILSTDQQFGTLTAPTALSLDLSVGRWLFRDRVDAIISGLAIVGEVHQFNTLQPTDGAPFGTPADLVSFAASTRYLYLTTLALGVHTQLGQNSTLRVAGVAPVSTSNFDGEMVVQFNYFY